MLWKWDMEKDRTRQFDRKDNQGRDPEKTGRDILEKEKLDMAYNERAWANVKGYGGQN